MSISKASTFTLAVSSLLGQYETENKGKPAEGPARAARRHRDANIGLAFLTMIGLFLVIMSHVGKGVDWNSTVMKNASISVPVVAGTITLISIAFFHVRVQTLKRIQALNEKT